jgi:hypothetical protein
MRESRRIEGVQRVEHYQQHKEAHAKGDDQKLSSV